MGSVLEAKAKKTVGTHISIEALHRIVVHLELILSSLTVVGEVIGHSSALNGIAIGIKLSIGHITVTTCSPAVGVRIILRAPVARCDAVPVGIDSGALAIVLDRVAQQILPSLVSTDGTEEALHTHLIDTLGQALDVLVNISSSVPNLHGVVLDARSAVASSLLDHPAILLTVGRVLNPVGVLRRLSVRARLNHEGLANSLHLLLLGGDVSHGDGAVVKHILHLVDEVFRSGASLGRSLIRSVVLSSQ